MTLTPSRRPTLEDIARQIEVTKMFVGNTNAFLHETQFSKNFRYLTNLEQLCREAVDPQSEIGRSIKWLGEQAVEQSLVVLRDYFFPPTKAGRQNFVDEIARLKCVIGEEGYKVDRMMASKLGFSAEYEQELDKLTEIYLPYARLRYLREHDQATDDDLDQQYFDCLDDLLKDIEADFTLHESLDVEM